MHQVVENLLKLGLLKQSQRRLKKELKKKQSECLFPSNVKGANIGNKNCIQIINLVPRCSTKQRNLSHQNMVLVDKGLQGDASHGTDSLTM
jgi:spore coat protein CotF